jgi:ammonium transporter, Amt family
VAGLVNYYSSLLIGFVEIDDVTDAIPVHFFNGVWGLVAAGLFTKRELYAETYSEKCVMIISH